LKRQPKTWAASPTALPTPETPPFV
jgi:hypothetical protein